MLYTNIKTALNKLSNEIYDIVENEYDLNTNIVYDKLENIAISMGLPRSVFLFSGAYTTIMEIMGELDRFMDFRKINRLEKAAKSVETSITLMVMDLTMDHYGRVRSPKLAKYIAKRVVKNTDAHKRLLWAVQRAGV